MTPIDPIDLAAKLARITTHWDPKLVAELNGQHVRLAKLAGEFVWHAHAAADELFLVLDGEFEMQFRDRAVTVRRGELIVVPRGVEHRPVAARECSVLLFEPAETLNTGDAPRGPLTRDTLERV